MKCSESWLREWCNPKLTHDALCHALTMAGLEVESVEAVAGDFKHVVVGAIIHIEPHPSADNLHCCLVDIGKKKPLSIVSGANNLIEGMKVPVAVVGAVLSNNQTIKKTQLRGVDSFGMLCSAAELGLTEASDGIMALADDAPIGAPLNEYLDLDDKIIDLSITPNRGDCLSVRGIAREMSVICKAPLKSPKFKAIQAQTKVTHPVAVKYKVGCPRYVGRVMTNVQADMITPIWLQEKLRRSGIRSINPIVDVTNYVMLELGQPMHAFDLNQISGGIQVRQSNAGEKVVLLDGSEHSLDSETMLIADKQGPLAIAGVMGCKDSGVTTKTTDIFLESAYFDPKIVARQRQYYLLNSDSAYRFERGVDPTIQREAIERATQLILAIAGGKAGPVIEVIDKAKLPKPITLTLSQDKLQRVLGTAMAVRDVEAIFKRFQWALKRLKSGWSVTVPSYRFDLRIHEDLIEEIARIYGYDNLPARRLSGDWMTQARQTEEEVSYHVRDRLCSLGYQEVITYSFISEQASSIFDPHGTFCSLVNPITADMLHMRSTLWPGLFQVLQYNQNRQQQRARLFEVGACFTRLTQGNSTKIIQSNTVAGLLTGLNRPQQWAEPVREVDFFDLKGDVCSLLEQSGVKANLSFKPDQHPALHPKQTAGIWLAGKKIGVMGALHPVILQNTGQNKSIYLFELMLDALCVEPHIRAALPSKYPEIRRDLSILVKQTVPFEVISDTIRTSAGDWLKDVFVFDVYQGKGFSPDLKSVALGLVIQHPSRTLVDSEVNTVMDKVVQALKDQLGAELRS